MKKKGNRGAAYWKKMESARVFQGNIKFMQAMVEMAFAFRLRVAFEIIRGINPITGKKKL